METENMVSRPHIMFVDDEPKILSGLKRALRAYTSEWDMTFQSDPEEALRAIALKPVQVAVLDIRMPKQDGIALAREIRRIAPQTICIILSGSSEFDVAVSSINDGHVFRFYVKPCETAELIAGLKAALDRHRRQQIASMAPLDLIPYGVIVVAPSGQALFANQQAQSMMSDSCGLLLDSAGQCQAMEPAATERLQHAIATARAEDVTTALSINAPDGSILRITAEPYRGQDTATARPVCLFLFSDRNNSAPDPGLLRDMFSLTHAEARLAAALTNGQSLEEAGTTCGITKSSARSYLKNIFSKLGVTRQAELVRMILVSLASR